MIHEILKGNFDALQEMLMKPKIVESLSNDELNKMI
jgi:hypothetical protein